MIGFSLNLFRREPGPADLHLTELRDAAKSGIDVLIGIGAVAFSLRVTVEHRGDPAASVPA